MCLKHNGGTINRNNYGVGRLRSVILKGLRDLGCDVLTVEVGQDNNRLDLAVTVPGKCDGDPVITILLGQVQRADIEDLLGDKGLVGALVGQWARQVAA
jgi:hypothetical protein